MITAVDDLFWSNIVDISEYYRMGTEEKKLKAELDELNSRRDSGRHDLYRIKAARKLTHGIEALGEFDNDLVRQVVERVVVKGVDRVVVRFCGGESVVGRV